MKIKILLLMLLAGISGFAQMSDRNYKIQDLAAHEAARHHSFIINYSLAANNYDMKYHRCEWFIDPAIYYINGSVTSYFVASINGLTQVEFDFADTMTVDSVRYHGSNVTYTQLNNVLSINLTSPINSGTLDSVSVYYRGAPVATGFGSFTQSFHNSIPIIATLSEPYSARDWWPCKQSLDDKIDSIDIIITTPQGYRAGTAGVLISETSSGNNKIYHWQSHYPITAYLVGIAVTNYAVYSDYLVYAPTDSLEILNYVYPEDSALAVTQTPFMLDVISLYDSLFITYPFKNEKYGHCQWNWGGGEEHQTMSFVSDFNGSLTAHECAHQWFGDMVTCGSFHDVWLNEGFATYLEALTQEFLFPPADWLQWKTFTKNNITSQNGGSVYCTDTINENRIFDWRLSYQKGAFVLHMLRWKLGDSLFFQSVRNYLNDPVISYGYARTSDLKNHMEAISGLNLTNFFDQWYYNQGFPTYNVSWNVVGNDLFVKVNQTQSDPSVTFFEMPVQIEFQNGNNDTLIVFDNTFSGQLFQTTIGFLPTTAIFDPSVWILANNSIAFDPSIGTNDFVNDKQLINVFPNPVSDKLFFNYYGKAGNAEITLKNSVGQNVFETQKFLSEVNNEMDFSNLSAGVYLLNVRTAEYSFNTKVIKK